MTAATIIIECESCASSGGTEAARIESEGGEEGDRLRRVRVAVKHVAKAALYVVETVFRSIHFAFLITAILVAYPVTVIAVSPLRLALWWHDRRHRSAKSGHAGPPRTPARRTPHDGEELLAAARRRIDNPNAWVKGSVAADGLRRPVPS